VHPYALFASLALHLAVLVWLVIAMPDFGEELMTGDAVEIDVVMEEADTPPQIPAEAAPLPERAPTRTPPPAPDADAPSPEPAGTPPPEPGAEPAEAEPTPPEPEPADDAESEAPEAAVAEEMSPPEPQVAAETAPAEPEPAAETSPAEPEPEAPTETRMAGVAEPPRRRPDVPAPAPEPEPEPEPAPATAEAEPAAPAAEPDATTVAEARDDTPAGAPQPAQDTTRDEAAEEDPVDALLQSVEQLARRVEADEERAGEGDADVATPTGRLAEMRGQRLGRLIYEQIVGCWNPPAGLDGLREVGPVEIRAEFRQNGGVVSAQVADEARLATDRVFRSVAESARRAVYNCAPLEGMPPEFFSQWRVVILEFRPDQIAAGG
jgi:hypothetical protein